MNGEGEETNIFQISLLNSTLDNPCSSLVVFCYQRASDDRRANDLRSVDDFLDTRDSESDVHGGDTGEMESLQGHLGSWFTNRLGADGAHRRPGLYFSLLVLGQTLSEEFPQMFF